jgi:hypothetical protein
MRQELSSHLQNYKTTISRRTNSYHLNLCLLTVLTSQNDFKFQNAANRTNPYSMKHQNKKDKYNKPKANFKATTM